MILTLKHIFFLLLLLYTNLAIAESFRTVEAYLAHITNGRPITSSSFESTVNGSVFGAVQWSLPENVPERESNYAASVFVLEKMKGGAFKEIVRSNPSSGFSEGRLQVFDGIEIQSNTKFIVRLHNFIPLGTIEYQFAKIGQSWELCSRHENLFGHTEGDEAVGDTRMERSTNFITGKIIEKQFRRNKLVSTKRKDVKFPKFPLAKFKVFDEKHDHL